MCPKPSKLWYFCEKIGGSTEKSTFLPKKKSTKKALFRKLQEKKTTSVKKKHKKACAFKKHSVRPLHDQISPQCRHWRYLVFIFVENDSR